MWTCFWNLWQQGGNQGAGGWVASPHLPAQPLPAPKGCPVLIQSDPYFTSTHREELQYHYSPWHAMS